MEVRQGVKEQAIKSAKKVAMKNLWKKFQKSREVFRIIQVWF